MSERVDLLVVGAGAMGCAAAWAAARRGHDVAVLERFEPGHAHGASHGSTRNLNHAYDADDYLDLLAEADRMWDELADEHGEPLVDRVGLVNHGDPAQLGRVREAHRRHGIASEMLSAADATERWPMMRFRGDALHVPRGGRVRAAEALLALRMSAERSGARFRYGTPVTAVRVRDDDTAVVRTEDGEYRARRVIVTAGAWTSGLLGRLVALPALRVTEEHPAHFAVRDADDRWPSFNHFPDPAADSAWWPSLVYGMLSPGTGVKAGWHGVGRVVDPDRRPHEVDPDQLGALRRYVREWLPGADADRFETISCTYTSTPTEDFVLDRVGPIVVGAGFSGHGFKFTPAIGRVLVDLAEGRPAAARFRLPR